jgi:hypothetical protein
MRMTTISPHQKGRLRDLGSLIRSLAAKKRSPGEDRRLADGFREVLRTYCQTASGGTVTSTPEGRLLRRLASQAMSHLGGGFDPASTSLKNYDHQRYGPYLGVSDEGSAARAIRRAALASPKAVALKTRDPMVIGVAVDAERLGGVGETAVGPEEYTAVRLGCAGGLLSSTNVGTRVNLRFYRRHPVVRVTKGDSGAVVEKARNDIRAAFEPFLRTPGGKPRPLTVFVEVMERYHLDAAARVSLLKELAEYCRDPNVADPSVHRLGYQQRIPPGKKGRDVAKRAIDIAAAAGLRDVAVVGRVRAGADEHVSYPGLLNYLPPGALGPVLRHADKLGIRIRPANKVDPETVARHVWSSLQAARQMGCDMGKYGLFPLTLEESETVIAAVQRWFRDWTAAPVFFMDQGLVSATRVDTHGDLIRGLRTWLRMVAKHRVPVVLVDTVDKSKKRSLLRLPGESKGYLSVRSIADVDRLARSLGVKVLWAGGITLPQAFVLGRLGVFGIYVTSAASSPSPVPAEYEADPWLPAVKEPTYEGVFRTKLLLEAGFLSGRSRSRTDASRINDSALRLITILQGGDDREASECQRSLVGIMKGAWRRHAGETDQRRTNALRSKGARAGKRRGK